MNGTKVLKCPQKFVFHSSGSTGVAKRVERASWEIAREVEHWAKLLPVRRILRVARPQHIYGYLWGWALGEAQQIESIAVRGWTAEEFAGFIRSGDLVVGFVSAWKRWQNVRWPENVTAVHAGDPVEDGVCEALLDHGLSRWIDVLGCTEHGALGLRQNRDRVYHLLPWWPDHLRGIPIEDKLQWLDNRSFVHLGRKGYSTTKRVSTSTSSELA